MSLRTSTNDNSPPMQFGMPAMFWVIVLALAFWAVVFTQVHRADPWTQIDQVAVVDVDGMCRDASRAWHGSGVMIKACIEAEQDAYDDLKRRWDDLPIELRRMCTSKTRSLGRSYSQLQVCINTEEDAFRRMPRFRP